MAGRKILTVSKDRVALVFYSFNLVLFMAGIDLWLTQSIGRVVILYSIFSTILFRASADFETYDNAPRRVASSKVLRLLAVVLVVLIAASIVGTYQSLYARPAYLMAALGVTIVLFVIVVLASCGQSAFQESFALFAAISIILLVTFGGYLAQPNLTISPPYSGVDAYRDYANAVRILSLSRFDPAMMILERYFRAFPVVPLMIVNISLVSGLPINISHLLLATSAEALTVTSLFLLSKRITRNHARVYSYLPFLPVLLVYLQPTLALPASVVVPLAMSVPIVTLVLYFVYTRVLGVVAPSRSATLTLVLLIMITVPLHATATIAVILFLIIVAFSGPRRHRGSLLVLVILATSFFFLYLFSIEGGPIVSVLQTGQLAWNIIGESMRPGFLPGLAPYASSSEIDVFLQTTVPALLLSVFTTFIVKLALRGRKVVADAQRSFYIILGVLAVVGFGVTEVTGAWNQFDPRYLIVPLTPVAVMATAMVILWTLGDLSPRRRILVVGLMSLCVLSLLTSPVYLESNPAYTRLMPIESERSAAMFVSTTFDARASDVTQIVTDWPYYNEVRGLLYSSHIGIEGKVSVANLMFTPMMTCQETLILSRRYFMQSRYLQTVSPYVKPLSDNSTWSHFNKVFDDYSVSIYVGSLSC